MDRAVRPGKTGSTVGAPIVPRHCEQDTAPGSSLSPFQGLWSAQQGTLWLSIIHPQPSPADLQPNPRFSAPSQVLEPHSLIQIHTSSKQHVIPTPAQFLLLKATRGPQPGNLLDNATETATNSWVKAFSPPLQRAEIVVASLENTTNLLQRSFLAGSLLQSLSLLPAEC